MSRINTNVSSLIAQRALANNNQNLNTSLERLSTGLKINSGADDPAGLIASQGARRREDRHSDRHQQRQPRHQRHWYRRRWSERSQQPADPAHGLVNQSANTGGLSTDEVAANQLQVDSILSTINRIAGSTTFEGNKLLNGNLAYTTSGAATSAFGSHRRSMPPTSRTTRPRPSSSR